MIPILPRRLFAALLVTAGLVALLAGAARQEIPLSDSVAMAGQFWGAGARARLLNAPGLARDAAFADDALRAAVSWPLDADAVLFVGPLVPSDVRERLRRKAAYLLAPRRVRLGKGKGTEVRLTREPTGDAAP